MKVTPFCPCRVENVIAKRVTTCVPANTMFIYPQADPFISHVMHTRVCVNVPVVCALPLQTSLLNPVIFNSFYLRDSSRTAQQILKSDPRCDFSHNAKKLEAMESKC